MIRVAVLYNVDYDERSREADAGFCARADVASAASAACEALQDGKHEPVPVSVWRSPAPPRASRGAS
jgi:hypothetical protein